MLDVLIISPGLFWRQRTIEERAREIAECNGTQADAALKTQKKAFFTFNHLTSLLTKALAFGKDAKMDYAHKAFSLISPNIKKLSTAHIEHLIDLFELTEIQLLEICRAYPDVAQKFSQRKLQSLAETFPTLARHILSTPALTKILNPTPPSITQLSIKHSHSFLLARKAGLLVNSWDNYLRCQATPMEVEQSRQNMFDMVRETRNSELMTERYIAAMFALVKTRKEFIGLFNYLYSDLSARSVLRNLLACASVSPESVELGQTIENKAINNLRHFIYDENVLAVHESKKGRRFLSAVPLLTSTLYEKWPVKFAEFFNISKRKHKFMLANRTWLGWQHVAAINARIPAHKEQAWLKFLGQKQSDARGAPTLTQFIRESLKAEVVLAHEKSLLFSLFYRYVEVMKILLIDNKINHAAIILEKQKDLLGEESQDMFVKGALHFAAEMYEKRELWFERRRINAVLAPLIPFIGIGAELDDKNKALLRYVLNTPDLHDRLGALYLKQFPQGGDIFDQSVIAYRILPPVKRAPETLAALAARGGKLSVERILAILRGWPELRPSVDILLNVTNEVDVERLIKEATLKDIQDNPAYFTALAFDVYTIEIDAEKRLHLMYLKAFENNKVKPEHATNLLFHKAPFLLLLDKPIDLTDENTLQLFIDCDDIAVVIKLLSKGLDCVIKKVREKIIADKTHNLILSIINSEGVTREMLDPFKEQIPALSNEMNLSPSATVKLFGMAGFPEKIAAYPALILHLKSHPAEDAKSLVGTLFTDYLGWSEQNLTQADVEHFLVLGYHTRIFSNRVFVERLGKTVYTSSDMRVMLQSDTRAMVNPAYVTQGQFADLIACNNEAINRWIFENSGYFEKFFDGILSAQRGVLDFGQFVVENEQNLFLRTLFERRHPIIEENIRHFLDVISANQIKFPEPRRVISDFCANHTKNDQKNVLYLMGMNLEGRMEFYLKSSIDTKELMALVIEDMPLFALMVEEQGLRPIVYTTDNTLDYLDALKETLTPENILKLIEHNVSLIQPIEELLDSNAVKKAVLGAVQEDKINYKLLSKKEIRNILGPEKTLEQLITIEKMVKFVGGKPVEKPLPPPRLAVPLGLSLQGVLRSKIRPLPDISNAHLPQILGQGH